MASKTIWLEKASRQKSSFILKKPPRNSVFPIKNLLHPTVDGLWAEC